MPDLVNDVFCVSSDLLQERIEIVNFVHWEGQHVVVLWLLSFVIGCTGFIVAKSVFLRYFFEFLATSLRGRKIILVSLWDGSSRSDNYASTLLQDCILKVVVRVRLLREKLVVRWYLFLRFYPLMSVFIIHHKWLLSKTSLHIRSFNMLFLFELVTVRLFGCSIGFDYTT